MKVAIAQLSPIWLDKKRTLEKVKTFVLQAADQHAKLVVFGEALLPGYPFWLAFTGGAVFNDKFQKEIYAHDVQEAVNISSGELDELCLLAKQRTIAIYLGTIERATDRGGHSLYCTLVYINELGEIKSTHRKLQPTYEERLVWSPGDGAGLQVHPLHEFNVGGLNCWENWMPLSRTALYAQGENLHVAVWPGCLRNTADITEFIAKEGRSYVVSVSGIYDPNQISDLLPHAEKIKSVIPMDIANGGSGIMDPTGKWVIEPIVGKEGVFVAELDLDLVYQERQNFDPTGHYSRPDITKLVINSERQALVQFTNDKD